MLERIEDIDNLYDAFVQIKAVSSWKEETQRYDHNLMNNLIDLSNKIKKGTYFPKNPRGFMMNERGKPRFIESRNVDDRIILRAVHDHIVLPAIMPKIIYDNAASIKNRGTDFFRRRLVIHLKEFAKEYGTDGYILLGDFTKFFDNIQHAIFMSQLAEIIPEQAALDFIGLLVYAGAVDVSYMNEFEYIQCMNVPFNSLLYHQRINMGQIQLTGEKYMYKSMGIGSQLSQDAGVYYPHRIDNYVKIVKSVKGYARYMDDFYAIHHDKEFLWKLLDDITQIASQHGLFLNTNKTQIVSLKREFSILQTRYRITENGNVLCMPNNDTFEREHRKLKKQAYLLHAGEITFTDIYNAYKSWKGMVIKSNMGGYPKPLELMDDYFNYLFIDNYPYVA